MSLFLSTLRTRATTTFCSRPVLSAPRPTTSTNSTTTTTTRLFSLSPRAMAGGKHEWLVILPDVPGKLSKRMEVRPDHLAAVKPNVEAGRVTMGGATLDEPIKDGEGPKINGSVFMVQADTKEEVNKLIDSDIYTSSGVWDLSKVQIIPFKSAVRTAL